jgi:hypothetical protein
MEAVDAIVVIGVVFVPILSLIILPPVKLSYSRVEASSSEHIVDFVIEMSGTQSRPIEISACA